MIELSRKELSVYKIILTCEIGRDIIERKGKWNFQPDASDYNDWPMMLKIEIGNVHERLRQP